MQTHRMDCSRRTNGEPKPPACDVQNYATNAESVTSESVALGVHPVPVYATL